MVYAPSQTAPKRVIGALAAALAVVAFVAVMHNQASGSKTASTPTSLAASENAATVIPTTKTAACDKSFCYSTCPKYSCCANGGKCPGCGSAEARQCFNRCNGCPRAATTTELDSAAVSAATVLGSVPWACTMKQYSLCGHCGSPQNNGDCWFKCAKSHRGELRKICGFGATTELGEAAATP